MDRLKPSSFLALVFSPPSGKPARCGLGWLLPVHHCTPASHPTTTYTLHLPPSPFIAGCAYCYLPEPSPTPHAATPATSGHFTCFETPTDRGAHLQRATTRSACRGRLYCLHSTLPPLPTSTICHRLLPYHNAHYHHLPSNEPFTHGKENGCFWGSTHAANCCRHTYRCYPGPSTFSPFSRRYFTYAISLCRGSATPWDFPIRGSLVLRLYLAMPTTGYTAILLLPFAHAHATPSVANIRATLPPLRTPPHLYAWTYMLAHDDTPQKLRMHPLPSRALTTHHTGVRSDYRLCRARTPRSVAPALRPYTRVWDSSLCRRTTPTYLHHLLLPFLYASGQSAALIQHLRISTTTFCGAYLHTASCAAARRGHAALLLMASSPDPPTPGDAACWDVLHCTRGLLLLRHPPSSIMLHLFTA